MQVLRDSLSWKRTQSKNDFEDDNLDRQAFNGIF